MAAGRSARSRKKSGTGKVPFYRTRIPKTKRGARAHALALSAEIPVDEQIKSGKLTFLTSAGGKITLDIIDGLSRQLVGAFQCNRLMAVARLVPSGKEITVDVWDLNSGKGLRGHYFFRTTANDITHMRLPKQLRGTGISDKIFQIADAHARATSTDNRASGSLGFSEQKQMIQLLKRAGFTITPKSWTTTNQAYKQAPANPEDNLNTHFKILVTSPKDGKETYLIWKKSGVKG
jgi:hypothetical protein